MNLKIGILFGEWSVGARPLDFNNIYDNPRGLTGSDLSCVVMAKELAARGHDISLFTVHTTQHPPSPWEGVKLYHIRDARGVINSNYFDALISINEPDAFNGLTDKPLRICWHFLNDFSFCQPNYEQNVDLFLGVCEMHVNHLKKYYNGKSNWGILPLGCDSSWYGSWDKKVKGRMIFCSSPDRGLHLALQCFPQIKKEVPEAHLKVFYHFQTGSILEIEPHATNTNIDIREMSNRLRWIKEAMERLKPLGVEHVGSVSVNEMKKQMSEASLLLFPVSTVSFTEGFSLSIMSSLASGTIAAISGADCLGSIYQNSGCIIMDPPIENHMEEYTQKVIRALKDQEYADDIRKKCLEFSKKYNWSDIANGMEQVIKNHPKFGK